MARRKLRFIGKQATGGGNVTKHGSPPGQQSEPSGNKPITGTNTAMRPTDPVLTDAAHPSSDAQKLVKQPPTPFHNPHGTVNAPVGTGPRGAVPGFGAKGLYAGKTGSKAPHVPNAGPVGGGMPKRKGIGAAFYGEY